MINLMLASKIYEELNKKGYLFKNMSEIESIELINFMAEIIRNFRKSTKILKIEEFEDNFSEFEGFK